jgi:D-galactarolactone cycloisomerase
VKAALSIPVAGGECEFTRFGFRDLLASRAIDIIQPDTCAAGGLSECKKIADMAEAFGVRYNPHVWGTGIAIAASLQLLAVLPTHTPNSLSPLEPLLEFDRTEHPIRQSLLVRPIEHENGIVRIPDGPGLGIEVNRDMVARFAVK